MRRGTWKSFTCRYPASSFAAALLCVAGVESNWHRQADCATCCNGLRDAISRPDPLQYQHFVQDTCGPVAAACWQAPAAIFCTWANSSHKLAQQLYSCMHSSAACICHLHRWRWDDSCSSSRAACPLKFPEMHL